jgi:hypothetical protein
LLCIDTASARVRRYDRVFDALRVTDEFQIAQPQLEQARLLPALETIRRTSGLPEDAFA